MDIIYGLIALILCDYVLIVLLIGLGSFLPIKAAKKIEDKICGLILLLKRAFFILAIALGFLIIRIALMTFFAKF